MTTNPTRTMALTMFMLPFGYHTGVWRHPESRSSEVGQLSLIRDMAQAAERAKLHAAFFADSLDVSPLRVGGNRASGRYDPIVTMSALIGATDKLGLIGTMSTTFSDPYNLARHFAALDTLSDGRAGWNIVTSVAGHENFGMSRMPDSAERYRRATEFVDVVTKLWESWDPDAVIDDKAGGRWADPAKIRDIGHVGDFYDVRGALTLPRPPQGHPVLVQAGQSEAGIELGSSVGDVIYTAQPVKERSIAFYDDFKSRVASKGRDPERVKILPGIMPIVAETQADADEIAADYAQYIDPVMGRTQVESMLDIDTSDLDIDDRVPAERLPDIAAARTPWQRTLLRLTPDHSIRELMVEASRAGGHQWIASTPEKIADLMIDWFDSRACDGFNLNAPQVPVGMNRMLDLLVPELQERGYFQHEYRGDTLRERMGLAMPTETPRR